MYLLKTITDAKNIAKNMLDSFERRFDFMEYIFDDINSKSDPFNLFARNNTIYDIIQTETGYKIEIALAGFTKDEIKVTVSDEKLLSVLAEKDENKKDENRVGKISRSSKSVKFSLPKKFTIDNVKYVDGILNIDVNIPREDKMKETSERIIPIQ